MMEADNGILTSVPGQFVSAAHDSLPPAAIAEDRPYEVLIEAGHIGWVRLYMRRMKARHHKHSHWFWSVYRAEPASPPDAVEPR